MRRMLGRANSVWARFLLGGIVIVGMATAATLLFLHERGTAEVDETDWILGEHVHTSRVSFVGYHPPPRSSDRKVTVLAPTQGYCVGTQRKPQGVHALFAESADAVLFGPATVHEFQNHGGGCAGIGYDAPVTIRLSRRLGERALLAPAKGGGVRTIWPSEDQFRCMRDVGGQRANRRLHGARTRDQIATEKQVMGLFQVEDRWGGACSVSAP
jgi:hypothetical protein